MGNSCPLAIQTVMTWTASSSDSMRRAVTLAVHVGVGLGFRVQRRETPASGHAGQPTGGGSVEQLGQMVEVGQVPVTVGGAAAPGAPRRSRSRPGPGPRPRSGRPACPTRYGAGPAGRPAAAPMPTPPRSARQPTNHDRAKVRTRRGSDGRSMAWSRYRICSAAGDSSTLSPLATTAGTPWPQQRGLDVLALSPSCRPGRRCQRAAPAAARSRSPAAGIRAPSRRPRTGDDQVVVDGHSAGPVCDPGRAVRSARFARRRPGGAKGPGAAARPNRAVVGAGWRSAGSTGTNGMPSSPNVARSKRAPNDCEHRSVRPPVRDQRPALRCPSPRRWPAGRYGCPRP